MIKARYTNEEHTAITVTLEKGAVLGNFFGPAEFSVGMERGNKEYDALELLVADDEVKVEDFIPPEPPFTDVISDRQFFQQMAIAGEITRAEALAAVKTGAIPDVLAKIIQSFPEADRFNAEMLISGATTFSYSNPLTLALGAAMGRSEAEMKQIWRDAAELL